MAASFVDFITGLNGQLATIPTASFACTTLFTTHSNDSFLVATIALDSNTASVSSITTSGVTWTRAGYISANSHRLELWYAKNVDAVDGTSVTFNLSAAVRAVAQVCRFTGVPTDAVLDVAVGTASGISSIMYTGYNDPTTAVDLCIGAVCAIPDYAGFLLSPWSSPQNGYVDPSGSLMGQNLSVGTFPNVTSLLQLLTLFDVTPITSNHRTGATFSIASVPTSKPYMGILASFKEGYVPVTHYLSGTASGTSSASGTAVANQIRRIQSKTAIETATSTLSMTLDAAPTPGNALLLVIGGQDDVDPFVTSVAQTGVTWSRIASERTEQSGNYPITELWLGIVGNSPGTGITVVTISDSASTNLQAVCAEYSGASHADKTATAQGQQAAIEDPMIFADTAAPTYTNELWIGAKAHRANDPSHDVTNHYSIVGEISAGSLNTENCATGLFERIVDQNTEDTGFECYVDALRYYASITVTLSALNHEVSGTASASCTASADPHPISLIQSKTVGSSGAQSSVVVNLDQAPQERSVLIAFVHGGLDTQNLSSIVQTGVVWAELNNSPDHPDSGSRCHLWYGIVGAGAGSSLTINSPAAHIQVIVVSEWEGIDLDTLHDQTAGNQNTGTTPSTGNTATTTYPVQLWIGGMGFGGSGKNFAQTPTNGFQVLGHLDNADTEAECVFRKMFATGSAGCTDTLGASDQNVGLMTTWDAIRPTEVSGDVDGQSSESGTLTGDFGIIGAALGVGSAPPTDVAVIFSAEGDIGALSSVPLADLSALFSAEGDIAAALSIVNAHTEVIITCWGTIQGQSTVEGDVQKIVGCIADNLLQSTVEGDVQKIVGLWGTVWGQGYAAAPLTDTPRVMLIEARTPTSFRVTFSEEMLKDDNLSKKTNYTITPQTPGSAFLYINSILPDNVLRPFFVDVNVSEMTDGADYKVEVNNITDKDGNPIDVSLNKYTFVGLGGKPYVKRVEAVADNLVKVVFSERMKNNPDLRNPSKYAFNNGLIVIAVQSIEDDAVILLTSEQDPNLVYDLTVTP